MVATPINPAQILNSYRKTDAVVIVCQNNTKKMIEIAAINDEAAKVMGYTNDDLVGKAFETILPERVSSTVAEFVEFEEDKSDLFFVLSKIRNFSIKTREGKEKEFKLRIIHGESIDKNPWFHLVLIDEERVRKANSFRTMLKENFKGHEVLDEDSGLPTRESLTKDLDMVVYHVRSKAISASIAIIDINDYEGYCLKYGPDISHRMHQHIGTLCKQKLRGEDTIGLLSERSFGVILIDAPQEPAHMVLNRLRWAISVSPMKITDKQETVIQVNIGFAQIDGALNYTDVLTKCETYLEKIRQHANNSLQLVVTHNRRAPKDRRKMNMAVNIERRKKDRRNRDEPQAQS